MSRQDVVQLTYILASILFIVGLRSLTKVDEARRGMNLAALGMLAAIVGTLLQSGLEYQWILVGLVVGTLMGYPMGMWVPMTKMPERIAFSHMFGALAATLVGVAKYITEEISGPGVSRAVMAAIGFEILFGALTVTGSLIAFGKLGEFIPTKAMVFKGQNYISIAAFAVAVVLFVWLIIQPGDTTVFWFLLGLSFLLGFSFVLPIGGGDMPVAMSILNSYAGLAAAATGFAIDNKVLIIAGALDGASGMILSLIMAKAMNRSFGNIIFGAFGAVVTATGRSAEGLTINEVNVEDAATRLAYARKVVVIPGYGLAVAQAQHQVREMAQLIEANGGEVRYAIHPVAGRMPGHMNVLLAEANVPYDELLEMDEINPMMPQFDIALVVGANDVVNPGARYDETSSVYGMPIIDADKAQSVIVMKRSMRPGFAGIENELFYLPHTSMLFGDAKATITRLVSEIKSM